MSRKPNWNTFDLKANRCLDCGKDCTFDEGWCSECDQ